MLEVCHQVRGRLRLRIPGLLNDQQLAARLTASLDSLPGVSEVRLNPACGCLVVHHEPLLPAVRICGLIESVLSPLESAPGALLLAPPSAPRPSVPLALVAASATVRAPVRPSWWRRWLPWHRRTVAPRPLDETAPVPSAPRLVISVPASPGRDLDHHFGHREPRRAGVPPARRAGRPSPVRKGQDADRGRARRPAAPPLAYRVQFEMVRRVLSNSLECLWYDFRFGPLRAAVMEPPAAPVVPVDLFDRLLARPLGLDGVAAAALGRTRR